MLNPAYNLELYHWQYEYLVNPSDYKVLCAARQSGKTLGDAVDMAYKAMGTSVGGDDTRGCVQWYIAPTYKMAKRLMWDRLIGNKVVKGGLIPDNYIKKINKTELSITLKNDSTVLLFGADNPDGIRGDTIDFLKFDEFQDIKPAIWEAAEPLVAKRGGKIDIKGTPKGMNQFHEFYLRGEYGTPSFIEDWFSMKLNAYQAGNLPVKTIERARRAMSDRQFMQEYMASFSSGTGRAYPAFDHKLNVSDAADYYLAEEMGVIRIGIDFNRNPMSALVIVKKGNMDFVIDEIVIPDSYTEEFADELRDRFVRNGNNNKYKHVFIYPDPTGCNGNTSSSRGVTNHTLLSGGGLTLVDGKVHPVIDSVNEVNSMLCNANNVRRMIINPRCKVLIKSLGMQLIDPKTGNPEKTNDEHDLSHITDALRYYTHIERPINRNSFSATSL